jgi:tape measure domain-containing protein
MSTTIDNRVVEMQFDNKHFEKNVATSLSTLDKLKQSLNLTGAAKGLEEVNAAANKCDMSVLGKAADIVGTKFSAMQVMAVTALANITNSAVNAGKRIASALTIEPVKAGFNEYELKMGSIQTIMASTGESLETVNGYLNELNEYSDRTIYSFQDMTSNIGKFTNAGISLKDSVKAIQGVSNVAAVSGANANEASRAMYNFSQALSSGYVKLIDWKSIENANMATVEFKNQLLETALAAGTLSKTSDGMYKTADGKVISATKNFNDSLQDQWMTSEVLIQTLGKYSDETTEIGKKAFAAATEVKTFSQLFDTLKESAQSGWAQTWEIIVGDFEEAKGMLTILNDFASGILGRMADARNELLENWKVLGGRDALMDAFVGLKDVVASIVNPIKEAFRDIFPPMTAEKLVAFTEGLRDFIKSLKLSDETSNNLKRTFKGLFAAIDIVKQAFVAVVKAGASLLGVAGDIGGGILSVTAKFGDWIVKIRDFLHETDIFNKVLTGTVTVIKTVSNAIKLLVTWIKEKFAFPAMEAFHGVLERIHERFSGVGEAASSMASDVKDAFSGLGASLASCSFVKVLKSMWEGLKAIGAGLAKVFGKLAGGFFTKLAGGDFNGIVDFINGLISGGIGIGIIKFIDSLSGPLDSLSDIGESFKGIIDGVGDCLGAFEAKLKADALQKIAIAIAILAASILVISLIDSEKLSTALGAVAVLFTELMIAFSVFSKLAGGVKGVGASCAAMISISVSVLILAAALKTISSLNFEELGIGLLGIAGLMTIMVAAIKVLGSGKKAVIKGALQVVLFAAAIKILASAINDIAYIGWEGLAKGLVGVGVLMGSLLLFTSLTKSKSNMVTTAVGVILIAAAIKILASACEDFGFMSWEEIGKGLAAVGALLLEVALFTNLSGNAKKVIASGVALIAISAAMKIFASAAQDMARMSWEEIGKGLLSMGAALGMITIALRLMPKNLVSSGLGLIAIAAALLMIASVLDKLGGQTWEEIVKGMVALGGAMAILAIGLHAMNGTLGGTAALIAASLALGILAPTLAFLGAMSWEAIAKGLITIAAAFTIIGVAGALLAPIVPVILGLAAAMLLVGVGVLAAGAGLAALGAGLVALSAGLTALVGSIGVVAVGIIDIIAAIIVGVVKGIGEGIIAICEVLIDGVPAIGKAIKVVVLELCDVLAECAPVIANTALKLLVDLMKSLVEYTPIIVDLLFDFIIAILDGLGRNIPDLVVAIMDFIGALFKGVLAAFKSVDTKSLLEASGAVAILTAMMLPLSLVTALLPSAMAGVVGIGVIIAELALVLAAVGALAQIPGLEWLINEGGDLLESIGVAIGKFIGGFVGGVMSGVTSQLSEIANDLSQFMTNLQPFIDGAKSIDESVLTGVKSIVDIILSLTAANIIEGLTSWITGGSSLTKFGEEIAAFGPCLKTYSDSVVGIDPAAVKASVEAARALAEMADVVPNEGGIVAWFTGENSIAKFGDELVTLGKGLKGFAEEITGIDTEGMTAAASAGKALAEMASVVPNEGGMASWFTGENSISKFGDELAALGKGLKGFADATVGINPEALTATAAAAKSLAEMTTAIPNEGGLMAWITGENSVSRFAEDLVNLGKGLKGFSDETLGVNPETMTASAAAAKSLADMTNAIPNEGGMLSWFTGDSSVSKFADDLVNLGKGIKGFSDETAGVNPETVTAAANAAKVLAEMTNAIPNSGGVVSWFTGDNSVSKFGNDLANLGKGLKAFSDETAGINPETMTAASNAGKALAEMSNTIPNSGGIAAWFAGEKSVAAFSDDLVNLGKGLKKFSDETTGVNPETITAASKSAKALGEMASVIPEDTSKVVDFGKNLVTFGGSLSSYYEKVSGISSESISGAKSAVDSIKDLGSGFNAAGMTEAANAIKDMVKALRELSSIDSSMVDEFKSALKKLGETSVKSLVKEFENVDDDMKKAGKAAIDAFVDGAEAKKPTATKAFKTLVSDCADAISDKSSSFETAGKHVVTGFADGISKNTFKAEAKAKAMALAALEAAKEALDENSPSKEFYSIGDFAGLGFVNALDSYASTSYKSGHEMADSARVGLRDALKRIGDSVNGDLDMQPTIRPVLDLSDVKSGASAISSILGTGTIGAVANVGAISTMMNRRGQNGNEEVVSAIDKLRSEIGNLEHATYNINGVSYEEGSDVADALRTIIRAATVERRS